MEVLAQAGLPAALFLDIPTAEQLKEFDGFRAIGIAGIARSKGPTWMSNHLPPIFAALAALQAPIAHYKICSTLDSSPEVGSIGEAIALARRELQSDWTPVLTAAPAIGRYQLFGNLFASVDGVTHRLDRHPVMSRHPVTPMAEADVRLHLAQQTNEPIGLIDYVTLTQGDAGEKLRVELSSARRLIALDVIDEQSLSAAGQLMWTHRGRQLFAVGSQGIEYALVAFWRSAGLLPNAYEMPSVGAVERVAVVSGSCSPITNAQIEAASAHGFELIRIDPCHALEPRAWGGALARATHAALRAIAQGRDPLVFTAQGPDDRAIPEFRNAIAIAGTDNTQVNEVVGRGLGTILRNIMQEGRLRRGVFAGGDTSSHGAKSFGFHALTLLAPIVPGAGLYRGHGVELAGEPLEIALKGGQMGRPDYFIRIKQGGDANS
jgi:uncharacterized protein YgbK (DUF1537 family)